MADVFGSGNREDKWIKKATEWINYLFNHKSDTLVAGQNITLTPDSTNHTVTISASGGGGGASSLSDLTDTNIDNPTDGQALVYDDGDWVNAPLPSAPVTDVQVNSTSIVDAQGIADIDLTAYAQTADLADVATSGSYNDLDDTPTLGTASAKDYTSSVTQGSADLVTSGAVFNAIDNLPEPMVFKGTLGTGGTITTLPTASASNEGYTYKVITAGTYASQSAKVGDVFVSNGSEWVLIPAGDTDSDTWRAINVNGTQAIGSAISTGAVNFKNGSNITITVSGNDITITAQDTTYSDATQSAHGLMSTSDKTKLDGIAMGAEVNVQSDWSQSDSTADDYIKNKPTIPTVNDGTLTITQNGTSKGTFTANQSGNATIALTDTTGYINQNETILATDKVPYVMRKAKNIANATPYIREMLVGGTIGWNQMIQNGDFESSTGWSGRYATVSVSSNVATLTPSSAGTLRGLTAAVGYGINIIVSHKYLLYCYVKPSINVTASCDFETVSRSVSLTANTWNFVPNIVNATTSTNIRFYCLVNESLTTSQSVLYKNVNVIDLTLMLGTTIADYIYNLETATVGLGIAKLREWGFFTKAYYPYNAGSVLSVQTRGHKITDANNENTVTYNVDDVILRGVPKLDTNNNLYYDGDTYSSDGHVIVKYSFVDMGSLSWIAGTAGGFQANISGLKEGLCGLRTAKYRYDETTSFSWANFSTLADKTIYRNSGSGNYTIYVKDTAYSDAASFTTAVSGNVLVYERATSSDTTWHPFENPQYVYLGGTEEYIDTREIPVPVGHITEYMGASNEKFYMPSSPLDDEKYMMTYHNGSILWTRGNAWISLLDGYYDAYAEGQNIALPPNWTRLKISLECHSLDLGDASKMIENEISRPTYEDGHYMSSGPCHMNFGLYNDLTCSVTLSESTFEGITTYYVKMESVTLGQTTTTDYHFWIYYQT